LKSFNKDRLDLDEMVALAAFGRMLRAEYEAQKVEEPEFLDVQLKTLRREIASKMDDKRETRRRQIKTQLQSLKTPAERRAELEKELGDLDVVA
jgi:ATP-dependent Lon protease